MQDGSFNLEVSYTADEKTGKAGMEGEGKGRTSMFSRERDFMRS